LRGCGGRAPGRGLLERSPLHPKNLEWPEASLRAKRKGILFRREGLFSENEVFGYLKFLKVKETFFKKFPCGGAGAEPPRLLSLCAEEILQESLGLPLHHAALNGRAVVIGVEG